eukprot:Clim_evm22s198 gene=Clim_evmTU22s198
MGVKGSKSLRFSGQNASEVPSRLIRSHVNATNADLSFNRLMDIPPELLKVCRKLKTLNLGHNLIARIPEEIALLVCLEQLSMNGNLLEDIPVQLGQLVTLKKLNLKENHMETINGEALAQLTQLTVLHMKENSLKSLPPEIGALEKLAKLYLRNNALRSLPKEIGNLRHLTTLSVYYNNLGPTLPDEIGDMVSLVKLYLHNNQIQVLPESLGKLKKLEILYLRANQLTLLPDTIGGCEKLQRLHLSWNRLRALPDSLRDCRHLVELKAAGNCFSEFPLVICELVNLQDLDLRLNDIPNIPGDIGFLKSLRKLYLRGLDITSLPPELGACRNLRKLNVRDCKLGSIPVELTPIVGLQLFISGNPLNERFSWSGDQPLSLLEFSARALMDRSQKWLMYQQVLPHLIDYIHAQTRCSQCGKRMLQQSYDYLYLVNAIDESDVPVRSRCCSSACWISCAQEALGVPRLPRNFMGNPMLVNLSQILPPQHHRMAQPAVPPPAAGAAPGAGAGGRFARDAVMRQWLAQSQAVQADQHRWMRQGQVRRQVQGALQEREGQPAAGAGIRGQEQEHTTVSGPAAAAVEDVTEHHTAAGGLNLERRASSVTEDQHTSHTTVPAMQPTHQQGRSSSVTALTAEQRRDRRRRMLSDMISRPHISTPVQVSSADLAAASVIEGNHIRSTRDRDASVEPTSDYHDADEPLQDTGVRLDHTDTSPQIRALQTPLQRQDVFTDGDDDDEGDVDAMNVERTHLPASSSTSQAVTNANRAYETDIEKMRSRVGVNRRDSETRRARWHHHIMRLERERIDGPLNRSVASASAMREEMITAGRESLNDGEDFEDDDVAAGNESDEEGLSPPPPSTVADSTAATEVVSASNSASVSKLPAEDGDNVPTAGTSPLLDEQTGDYSVGGHSERPQTSDEAEASGRPSATAFSDQSLTGLLEQSVGDEDDDLEEEDEEEATDDVELLFEDVYDPNNGLTPVVHDGTRPLIDSLAEAEAETQAAAESSTMPATTIAPVDVDIEEQRSHLDDDEDFDDDGSDEDDGSDMEDDSDGGGSGRRSAAARRRARTRQRRRRMRHRADPTGASSPA